MLEVLIPGVRYGEGTIDCATAYRGMFCYVAGFNASGKTVLKVPYSSAQAKAAVYPINKLRYAADYTDTSDAADKFTRYEECIFYEGGVYETNQWYPSSFGISAAYWAQLEDVSSSFGSRISRPGVDTAIATFGATGKKCYVKAYVKGSGKGNSLGANAGVLCGFASAAGVQLLNNADPFNAYVAVAEGIHGSSSADAMLRFRIVRAGYDKAIL